jgi:formylmethanofuran dehydrogenase subunit E
MNEKELETTIRDAVKLHGHLGPFLVLGVRMGAIANRILNPAHNGSNALQATVRLPLRTPYSCILDGIQSTTKCTIGNQRLKTIDSPEEMTAEFKMQGSDKSLIITTSPKIIDEIENEFSRGATNEELAAKIASAPEDQLFELKKQ